MRSRRVRGTSREVGQAAREMRSDPTPAERALWEELRLERLSVKFRRQHPVGRFILDFYCPSRRLCIEVDGPVHAGQVDRDAARDAVLGAAHIRVLRFTNEQVLTDRATVVTRITEALQTGTT